MRRDAVPETRRDHGGSLRAAPSPLSYGAEYVLPRALNSSPWRYPIFTGGVDAREEQLFEQVVCSPFPWHGAWRSDFCLVLARRR
jgi:hypothetical protein